MIYTYLTYPLPYFSQFFFVQQSVSWSFKQLTQLLTTIQLLV